MAAKKTPTKSRSGTTWTREDYKAHGYGIVELKLAPGYKERLRATADSEGVSMGGLVESWVDRMGKTTKTKKAPTQKA